MGAPKQLNRFSVAQMFGTLSLAREVATDFRSPGARMKALEHLKGLLAPMVEWLDKPSTECFPGRSDNTSHASTRRVLPLFQRFGELDAVVLDRKGDWLVFPEKKGIACLSSGSLADYISHVRYEILCSIPFPYKKQHLVALESMGMREVIESCAFLKYIACGMEELDKVLKEREERLRIIRDNFSFLKTFIDGIDPLAHGGQKPLLPGYSVFFSGSCGTSRSSRTYFVPGPAEKIIKKRNGGISAPRANEKYVLFNENRRPEKLGRFLSSVYHTLTDVSEEGRSGHEPFSEEEMKVIADFASKIGTS